MAYVNVLEWKAESVAEWLRGLDDSIVSYAHFFLNNNVTGKGLLNLTVDDLSRLQVNKIGHQELILEAIELLKNLHHNLDTENLQYVCLRLSCKARSLCNELRMVFPPPDQDKQRVQTSTMLSVGDILDSLLVVLSWLVREPFLSEPLYQEFKNHLQQIGTELATNTQRDTFAEKPVDVILDCCGRLADLSDSLIRDCNDPLILQPASLDVATTRKKKKKGHLIEDDDEDCIVFDRMYPNFVHIIGRGTLPSVKIDPGDEVIQVNYQTVVGWARKNVLRLINENPSEVTLTLKKRPRHSTVFGQIYMKPFRIPAREKKNTTYFNNLPSPRAELLVAPQIAMTEAKSTPVPTSSMHSIPSRSSSVDDIILSDIDSEDDEAFLPPPPNTRSTSNKRSPVSAGSPTQSIRSLLLSRPRSAPQRRATISGSSPAQYLNYSNMWNLNRREGETDTSTLRSNDSGMSTMSADPTEINRKSPSKHPDRSSYQFPLYTNIPENSRFFDKAVSKESVPNPNNMSMDSGHYSDVSSASKEMDKVGLAPKPTPRKQLDSNSSINYKKKPIPQPRTVIRSCTSSSSSSSSSSGEDKSCLMIPVPTAHFKSYRKYPEQPSSTPSITPITRLGSVSSSCSSSSIGVSPVSRFSSSSSYVHNDDNFSHDGGKKASPYYVSDVYPRDKVGSSRPLPPPPPPPAPLHNAFMATSSSDQNIPASPTFSTFGGPRPALPLPPIFKPSTYTLHELQKTKQK